MTNWQDKVKADSLTWVEREALQWQVDHMDSVDATLLDAAIVFDELENEE